MGLILNIETAASLCSVALAREGNGVAYRESTEKNSHSVYLTLLIEEVFFSSGISISEIDAVAVSAGPGSYTGLRIGVATAKGLCYALDKPLIAIDTLKALANLIIADTTSVFVENVKGNALAGWLVCPMLDARRMEVYCALFNQKLEKVRETRAEIIDENSFSGVLKDTPVLFAGEGAIKCQPVLGRYPNAIFSSDVKLSAIGMIRLSEENFKNGITENLAYFEPWYLKDFIAGKPKVKGLVE